MDAAIEAGAYGAKMIGGGFGGSVLALLPAERVAAVRVALAESFAARGWTPPEFLEAIPAPAARARNDCQGGGSGTALMTAALPAGVRNGTYTRPVAGL